MMNKIIDLFSMGYLIITAVNIFHFIKIDLDTKLTLMISENDKPDSNNIKLVSDLVN